MQKWEYLTVQPSRIYGTTKYYINGTLHSELKNRRLSEVMNIVGAQGWEMVGISTDKDGTNYIFKREAVAKQKPAQAEATPTMSSN
jgi:hypothetical protein